MNGRSLAGIPVAYWAVGIIAGVIGFVWMRSKTKAPAAAGAGAQPSFTQAQEVQDFQIFSALTGQQQASDLNFLSTAAGMFAGGSSPSTSSAGGGTVTPAPPSSGGMPPAVAQQYSNEVAGQLQFASQPQSAQLAQLANSPDKSALQSLSSAISSTPASQRGALENFFLLNEANQAAGYDYYTSQGLQTTPLGVAPGE